MSRMDEAINHEPARELDICGVAVASARAIGAMHSVLHRGCCALLS
jgi:hypothetical protein